MEESSEEEFSLTIKEAAEKATLELLPLKSRSIYESAYSRFVEYKRLHKVTSFSEDVFLAYFAYLSDIMSPSTLWSHYSMLKATLNIKSICKNTPNWCHS